MGTKRVVISMAEGLFLFLVLETLGKLSGFFAESKRSAGDWRGSVVNRGCL